jgi:hypothetical protein
MIGKKILIARQARLGLLHMPILYKSNGIGIYRTTVQGSFPIPQLAVPCMHRHTHRDAQPDMSGVKTASPSVAYAEARTCHTYTAYVLAVR